MCQLQKLYSDAGSYVVRCKECRYYQVLFGGVVLSISEEEFEKFMDVVNVFEKDFSTGFITGDAVIPAMPQGVHLLVDRHKTAQLNHILQAADTELKTQDMLLLFQA